MLRLLVRAMRHSGHSCAGKQLVGVAEQEGGRARRRPKKRSYLENPALLGRTSSGQREHRPSREAADSRVLQPKGPAAAVNTPVRTLAHSLQIEFLNARRQSPFVPTSRVLWVVTVKL